MQAHALLIFDLDIKTRNWLDWLSSHSSLAKPLHRYHGIITMKNNSLYFDGYDVREKQEVEIVINKHHITSLYYGYDKLYNLGEVRGLGMTWKPIRITFNENGKEQNLYLITNYNLGKTDNNEWLMLLQKWLA